MGSFPHWDRGCCSISSTNQYLGIRGQTTLSGRTLAAGGVRVKAHYGQQRDSLIPRWVTPRRPSGDPSTWTHQQPRQRAGLSSATCRLPSEKQSSRKAPRETAYVECGIRKGNRHGSRIWYSRLRALSSWGTGWRLGILKWWAAWTSRNCAHFLVFLGSSSRQGNFPVLLRSLSEAFCASALQKGLASHLWLFA